IIDSIAERLLNEYVFPDTARAMVDTLRNLERRGSYSELGTLEDLLGQIQQDLQSVYPDQHLRIGEISEHGAPPSLEDEIPSEQMSFWNEFFRFENYGIRAVTRLDGNVGYIDFRFWPDSALVTDRILATMSLLRGVDALIIDVRYHMGGRIEPARLVLSHLFDQPVHFVTSVNRLKDTQVEEWTAAVEERGMLSAVPIWVLTSNETASGGELLPFALKNLGRATVVGTRTRGAGLRAHQVTVPHLGLEMYISHAADVDPATGLGWEGTGVLPDVEVPATDALVRAHLEALEYLAENVTVILPNMKAERDWALLGLRAKLNDQHPSEGELERYTGTFGTRRIRVEDGRLLYQRDSTSSDLSLRHMADDWFMFDSGDLYYVRIHFDVDDSGGVSSLTMAYDNGQKYTYDRD
ncbi:MAG: hypothetical protein JSU65_05865, partial [Candidatus Zixiibacteriota bacterium]